MALISRVIENGRHISGRRDLDSQTWETFENIVRGKKFFLFAEKSRILQWNFACICGILQTCRKKAVRIYGKDACIWK